MLMVEMASLTNSVQGLTWRLGFGVWNNAEPEEWQSRPATANFELTTETYADLFYTILYSQLITSTVSTTQRQSGGQSQQST